MTNILTKHLEGINKEIKSNTCIKVRCRTQHLVGIECPRHWRHKSVHIAQLLFPPVCGFRAQTGSPHGQPVTYECTSNMFNPKVKQLRKKVIIEHPSGTSANNMAYGGSVNNPNRYPHQEVVFLCTQKVINWIIDLLTNKHSAVYFTNDIRRNNNT